MLVVVFAKRTGLNISYCRHNVRLIVMQVKAEYCQHHATKVYGNMFSFTQYSIAMFEYYTQMKGVAECTSNARHACILACRCGGLSK